MQIEVSGCSMQPFEIGSTKPLHSITQYKYSLTVFILGLPGIFPVEVMVTNVQKKSRS